MPGRSRKPRSTTKTYETVPGTDQAYFKAPKRRIRDKQPTWSAPSKYQQTITQMNPFRAIYHPTSEDEVLQADEEEEPSYVASTVGRKRRRITLVEQEAPLTQKKFTRSSARRDVKTEPQSLEKDVKAGLPTRNENDKPSKLWTPATLMPPPITPRTWRKREIPSSQSPADSPLSTQSRRSTRCYSRSPLKERSTNVILPAISTKKGGGLRARKLEVEDSMENEEEDSPILTRLRFITEPFVPNGMSEDLEANDNPPLPLNEIATGWRSSGEVPESSQRQSLEANSSTPVEAAKATKEIYDSDFEYDDEDAENESLDLVQGYVPLSGEPILSGRMSQHNSPDTTSPDSKPPDDQSVPDIPRALDTNAHENGFTPRKQRSEPEEASAQLFNDLQCAIQPGGLQTESQYENAWNSYHPANTTNDDLDDANTLSSAPIEVEEDEDEDEEEEEEEGEEDLVPAPETIPTQILSPAATPFKRRVPSSQATTTDMTQPSPRKMPSSSSLALPSSPPPMPPPIPSPLGSRKAVDPWVGFQWDGVRLTDSQLLPDSLMDDSYIGPPGGLELNRAGLDE